MWFLLADVCPRGIENNLFGGAECLPVGLDCSNNPVHKASNAKRQPVAEELGETETDLSTHEAINTKSAQ